MSKTATITESSTDQIDAHVYDDTLSSTEAVADESRTGAQVVRRNDEPKGRTSWSSWSLDGSDAPATGAQTPDPLLYSREVLSRIPTESEDVPDQANGIQQMTIHQSTSHMGNALMNLSRTMSPEYTRRGRADTTSKQQPAHESLELQSTVSRRARSSLAERRTSRVPPGPAFDGLAEEVGSPDKPVSQGRPPELRNLTSEIIFVLVCSAGQLLFAWFLGDVNVNQTQIKNALGIQNTQLPWLQGAFNVANALSVILSGSLSDLTPPKSMIVGAFAWLTAWNIVGAFALTPSRAILFFIVRAMQGLAIGVLVSGSMSMLGRVYSPGMRKTRVFSSMAAMAPFGFWLGALQGGALSAHLPWLFGTNAILCGLFAVAAYFTIPALRPVADFAGAEVPSLRQFDYLGAICAVLGCISLLFGLTQGSGAKWAPYTYALIIVGLVFMVAFFFVENRVQRPLIPNRLWKIQGFTPLMAAYFLGFGAFVGPWQFYAIQFWLRIQHVKPITVALYLIPNAIIGVLATWIVSRLMHRVAGHWIFMTSMIAFGLGPVFFLPQTSRTSYWALSMPGVAVATFGPDLSFAAASIFITSNVPRSYQGSAGSLLMTVQNLSAAIMTSVGDAIGAQVDEGADGEVGLKGLKAIWWFGFAAAMVGALITMIGVRIPREEEKEHIT